jgi:hypothetical protein
MTEVKSTKKPIFTFEEDKEAPKHKKVHDSVTPALSVIDEARKLLTDEEETGLFNDSQGRILCEKVIRDLNELEKMLKAKGGEK